MAGPAADKRIRTIPEHEFSDGSVIRVEEILPARQPVLNSVHRHGYHELFLFLKGSGTHMIDLDQVRIGTPSIHLVAPGQVHKLDRSADMEGMVVLFRPDIQHPCLFDPRMRAFLRPGAKRNFMLDHERSVALRSLISTLRQDLEHQANAWGAVLENELAVLLLKCFCWFGTSEVERGKENVVDRFLEQVDSTFLQKKQVADHARDLALTPGHLNELVKKRLGRNASEVIQERTILEAKRLLLHADLSVKEVSYALGMDDPAYFTRMFRKATGHTPSEYRTIIREKYQH